VRVIGCSAVCFEIFAGWILTYLTHAPANRYLLRTSPAQLASERALELRHAIMFKKDMTAAAGDDAVAAALHAAEPAPPVRITPSLSARARPEARAAAAEAAELAGRRRAAAKNGLSQNDK
jgi:hypothetical protein